MEYAAYRIMEVNGEGTSAAAPDRSVAILGTVTNNVALSAAQRDNAAAVSGVIASLQRLGIPKEHIQTYAYNIEIKYKFEDGEQIFIGYQVTHLLRVEVNRAEMTGAVVDTAVANGANTVSSIRFTVSRPEAYYNQALAIAVGNAASKAEAIARALGGSLAGGPVYVQELPVSTGPIPYQAALLAESAGTPVQPGRVNIAASVKVQYMYFTPNAPSTYTAAK
ncbi:SIMPL domain-containing protein [Paenibacillus thermotolerans]|uniref:SIMPL domain-containing protein n=1 Tax=Paenibacillus thermotolerans TaxID=3027807 RepID=UPI00236862A3|nr:MULTISPECIES: SIMPL domain-containing protein [unclassified Paenibacillus]